jgi:hypothetical protein
MRRTWYLSPPLSTWAYGEFDDKEQNVSLSVITHKNNQYTFYCYPSLDRRSAKLFHQAIDDETKRQKKTRDDIHQKLFAFLTLGKVFDIPPTSYLPTFRQSYIRGNQFVFRIFHATDVNQPEAIENLQDFVLYDIKIMDEDQLARKDIEFDLVKFQKK